MELNKCLNSRMWDAFYSGTSCLKWSVFERNIRFSNMSARCKISKTVLKVNGSKSYGKGRGCTKSGRLYPLDNDVCALWATDCLILSFGGFFLLFCDQNFKSWNYNPDIYSVENKALYRARIFAQTFSSCFGTVRNSLESTYNSDKFEIDRKHVAKYSVCIGCRQ